ncbi:MAG: hypothetical protein ACR2KV_01385 [Solirubrobacteraceae bacterium]
MTKIKELAGSTKPTLDLPAGVTSAVTRSIYGAPVYTTSQLNAAEVAGTSNSTSSIYVYAPSQILVVRRQPENIVAGFNLNQLSQVAISGGTLLAIDQASKFTSDQTAIRATLRADMVVPNPSSVVRITGVIPS